MTFKAKLMLFRGLSKIGNGQNKNYFHSLCVLKKKTISVTPKQLLVILSFQGSH